MIVRSVLLWLQLIVMVVIVVMITEQIFMVSHKVHTVIVEQIFIGTEQTFSEHVSAMREFVSRSPVEPWEVVFPIRLCINVVWYDVGEERPVERVHVRVQSFWRPVMRLVVCYSQSGNFRPVSTFVSV